MPGIEASPDAFTTLARVYTQTLGLALVLTGTGNFLYRTLFAGSSAAGLALRWARGYYIGISAFFAAYILLSRMIGARAALWVAVPLMCVLSLIELAANRRALFSFRPVWVLLAMAMGLVAIYSVTNAALWVAWTLPPSTQPGMWTHFGSIHAGRYANYAIFIAEQDRVPYLAQNGGQSMLASVHMLLGVDSPLAALMVWIPFSMAFLTLLVFGVLRLGGFPRTTCSAATFMVMFCNIAVSAVHVLVFDNGSPIAFIGYTDLINGVATFILFCMWFQAQLVPTQALPRTHVLLPALFAMTWCWYAPQNLVVAALSGAGVGLVWSRRYPSAQVLARLRGPAAVIGVAAVLGAVQFGSLLPKSMREDTGFWTQDVRSDIRVKPYIQYLRDHWGAKRWNNEVEFETFGHVLVEKRTALPNGGYREVAWMLEQNLWSSVRIYGFPLLGLALMGAYLRRLPSDHRERSQTWGAWWLLSIFSFGTGFLIFFWLELGGMKWWLTRFLVPGTAMALITLGLAAAADLGRLPRATRNAVWALLLVATTFGPVAELVAVAYRNFASRESEPFSTRLALLVSTKGPFLFEALHFDPEVATKDPTGSYTIGGDGLHQGVAIYSDALPMRPGRYRLGFRIDSVPAVDSALMELDVRANGGQELIARQVILPRELERRADGVWAWLKFDLTRQVKDAQFRLLSRAHAALKVTDMRLERQQPAQ